MSIENEIWKEVPGLNGRYLISSMGNIRYRLNPKRVIQTNRLGYCYINVRIKDITKVVMIHRTVAMLFVENPFNKPKVNHINGIKKDNRAENLEWVTQAENVKHAWDTGLRERRLLSAHRNAVPVVQFTMAGEIINRYGSIKEAALAVGASAKNLRVAAIGITKYCCGFRWKNESLLTDLEKRQLDELKHIEEV